MISIALPEWVWSAAFLEEESTYVEVEQEKLMAPCMSGRVGYCV